MCVAWLINGIVEKMISKKQHRFLVFRLKKLKEKVIFFMVNGFKAFASTFKGFTFKDAIKFEWLHALINLCED